MEERLGNVIIFWYLKDDPNATDTNSCLALWWHSRNSILRIILSRELQWILQLPEYQVHKSSESEAQSVDPDISSHLDDSMWWHCWGLFEVLAFRCWDYQRERQLWWEQHLLLIAEQRPSTLLVLPDYWRISAMVEIVCSWLTCIRRVRLASLDTLWLLSGRDWQVWFLQLHYPQPGSLLRLLGSPRLELQHQSCQW